MAACWLFPQLVIMKKFRCSVLLLPVILIVGVRQVSAEICRNSTSDEELNRMLALYEREDLPPDVNINLELDLHHASVHEHSSSVLLMADLYMSWNDTRLNWDSSIDCNSTLVDAERLWLPDIVLLNGGTIYKASGDPLRAKLLRDGSIIWAHRLDVVVPCTLNLQQWPNDIQECNFKFGSRKYTTDEMKIDVSNSKIISIWEAGAWNLLSSQGSVTILYRAGESYSIANWSISLQRRSPSHSMAIKVIFVTIVLELIAAALLSPIARVPLCASIAFSITLWMVAILLRLPGSATSPSSLSVMAALLVISCICAFLASIVQVVGRQRMLPPSWLRRMVTNFDNYFNMNPEHNALYGDGELIWLISAKVVDRIVLVILSVTLFIIICIFFSI